jgi:Fic family protein
LDLARIDTLKGELDARRPLPPATVASLHEDLVLRWTYHSNAIEGNTLTLMETKVVLEGVTVGGKTLREHLEAINHREAIRYVEQIVQTSEPLSEWQIRNLHRLVLKGIDDDNAGRYRSVDVAIAGARQAPPPHYVLAERMADFMAWYVNTGAALHPVARAAEVHTRFVLIHPFADGNGRTARLLLNLELLKAGFWPVVVPVERRLDYYTSLDAAWGNGEPGDFEPSNRLIAELVKGALADLLAFLRRDRA